MKIIIGQQGEVNVRPIGAIPPCAMRPVEKTPAGGTIISHSESGNHHILECGDVMERTEGVPAGMRIFYAILKEPSRLYQDAAVPHEDIPLPAGVIEFRTSREYDPFAEQARRVAD